MKLYIRNVWVIKFLSIWIDPILSTVIWKALVGQIIQTLKVIEKTKISIPAMLKPYSASSFCLPNKNRVGVARGDGTNLEVVKRAT